MQKKFVEIELEGVSVQPDSQGYHRREHSHGEQREALLEEAARH